MAGVGLQERTVLQAAGAALPSSDGPRFPGTTASIASGSESANAWVNPGNVAADDAAEADITAATFDSPDISERLVLSNFGFVLPAGATPVGVVVEIDRRSIIAGSGADFRVQLQDDTGALIGGNKANTGTTWPSTSAIVTYGHAFDTWEASLTEAIVEHANFGVVLSASALIANADIGVDFGRATVYYTVAGGQNISITAAVEADGAQPLSITKTIYKVLSPAMGTETAQALVTGPMVIREFAWTFMGSGSYIDSYSEMY